MSESTYKAYISYSHHDEPWAKWLHRAIESYRVPGKLVGVETTSGKIPARIRPVFRDRDDLSSSADLSVTVRQALQQSENLVVICSPHAVASRWVNEEIREFVRMGRGDRIYCIIVDGQASANGSVSALFPAALAESGHQEPLAADVRKWADGKHLARLKVIAGILGLPLDRLRQRDLVKRRKVRALAGVASIAIVTILIIAIMARISAQQRRESGESLVAIKLTELRTMLNVADDPETLRRLTQWDKKALDDLRVVAGDGENSLAEHALQLREQGQKDWQNGELDAAMDSFQDSWGLFAEQYRQDRNNTSAFFEIGQSDYWIGQVHQDQGNLRAAEDAFMSYAEITRRLILLQPENAEWVLEMSYALTNLGALENARAENNPERTLQFMQSSLEYNQIALVLSPNNIGYQSELGQSHLNLADAQRNVCDLAGAEHTLSESNILEARLLQGDKDNPKRMRYLAYTLSAYANVRVQQGYPDDALEYLQKSLVLAEAASAEDPNTRRVMRITLQRMLNIARLRVIQGKVDEAREISSEIERKWQSFSENQQPDDTRLGLILLNHVHFRSRLAQIQGDRRLTEQLLLSVLNGLADILVEVPGHRQAENTLAMVAFHYWESTRKLPDTRYLALLPEYKIGSGRVRACRDASEAVRKAIMLGKVQKASELTAYLLASGFRESNFIRECSVYNLCDADALAQ